MREGMAPMQRPDASTAAKAELDTITMVPAGQVQAFALPTPGGADLPCTEDPELFFAEAPADVEAAKVLCQGCSARAECLEGALERREPWGVWGGELLLRGTVVPRKRPRGRPRKDDPGFDAPVTVGKAREQAALLLRRDDEPSPCPEHIRARALAGAHRGLPGVPGCSRHLLRTRCGTRHELRQRTRRRGHSCTCQKCSPVSARQSG
jgi:WhiB family redox-sensing transcriptional regulator